MCTINSKNRKIHQKTTVFKRWKGAIEFKIRAPPQAYLLHLHNKFRKPQLDLDEGKYARNDHFSSPKKRETLFCLSRLTLDATFWICFTTYDSLLIGSKINNLGYFYSSALPPSNFHTIEFRLKATPPSLISTPIKVHELNLNNFSCQGAGWGEIPLKHAFNLSR